MSCSSWPSPTHKLETETNSTEKLLKDLSTNTYIRDQMLSYEAESMEAFGAGAVTMVQIKRCCIKLGDSDATQMDGLIPVTRPI